MTEDIIAGYHVNHEAWHWEAARLVDESASITVGLSHSDGSCKYEFSFDWGHDRLSFATLHLHDDGFAALTDPRFARLWAELAEWGRLGKTPMGNQRRFTPGELVATRPSSRSARPSTISARAGAPRCRTRPAICRAGRASRGRRQACSAQARALR